MRLAFDPPGLCDDLVDVPGGRLAGVDRVGLDDSPQGVVTRQASAVPGLLRSGHYVLLVPDPAPDGIIALRALEEESCRRLMLLMPWRFEPAATVIQQSLHQLGRPGLLRAHRWSSPTEATPNALPIRDILPEVDLGNWMFGDPPNRVFALAHTLPQGHCLQVHLGYRSGGMALFEYAWEPFFGEGYRSMTLIGASGAAYQEDMHDLHLQWCRGRPVAAWARPNGGGGLAAVQAFADAVRDRRPLPVTLSDALAAIRVTDAAHQSLISRTAVALPIHE